MFDEHIRNLETMIKQYTSSINNDNVTVNVTPNVTVNHIQNLTERESEIIILIKGNATITTAQMADIFNVSERTIKRDIASLKDNGFLARVGSDKNGNWKILK